MLKINEMWKTYKREIKELEYNQINFSEYIIIDVRGKQEFKEGHIKGAINIPLPDIRNNIEKVVANKDKKILLYCKSGIRSKKAAKILERLGYKKVYNLKGGIDNN